MVRPLASLPLLALAAVAVAADPPLRATPLGTAGAAAKWAQQLGDRDYQTREQASRELDALGEAAVPALEKVVADGTPEAVRRAAAVLARVQARADNARAIAAKTVDVDLDDKPFGTALADLQKQTGYQFRVNGDQAVLGKNGKFAAKKEPFWSALDRLAAAAGLEVESASGFQGPVSVNRDYAYELQFRQRQVERDLLQQQIQRAKVAASVLQNQQAAFAKKLAGLTADERKEKGPALEKELDGMKAQAARAAAEVADLEKKFAALTAAPPPAGTVVLRAAGTAKPNPTAVAGAVRIQATPFGGQPAQVSSAVIPLVLTATPEPSLRWVRTTETVITKATTPDGRVISYDPTAVSAGSGSGYDELERLQIQRLGRGRRFIEEYAPPRVDALGGFTPTPLQSLVRLHAPTGAAVTKLAAVEGVMRAKVWSQQETVAAVKGLSADLSRVTAPNGVSLEAKLTVDPNDKTAYYLDLVLTYDPTEVSPQGSNPNADPLYFDQLPGGGARPVRPRPIPRAAGGNPQGLAVTDGTGGAFALSLNSSETTGLGHDPYTGVNRLLRLKQRYIVRAAKSDSGPPTTLTFSGLRLREVDLPFKLTDVPVAAGTMDPKLAAERPAQPEFEVYKR